jgi:hypothetical protein
MNLTYHGVGFFADRPLRTDPWPAAVRAAASYGVRVFGPIKCMLTVDADGVVSGCCEQDLFQAMRVVALVH